MAQDHVCVAPLAEPGPCPICEAQIAANVERTAPQPEPRQSRVPEQLEAVAALVKRRGVRE